MTPEEAQVGIGRRVVYKPGIPGGDEAGVITGVGQLYVFVRYDADGHSKATPPELLAFEVPT